MIAFSNKPFEILLTSTGMESPEKWKENFKRPHKSPNSHKFIPAKFTLLAYLRKRIENFLALSNSCKHLPEKNSSRKAITN